MSEDPDNKQENCKISEALLTDVRVVKIVQLLSDTERCVCSYIRITQLKAPKTYAGKPYRSVRNIQATEKLLEPASGFLDKAAVCEADSWV